MFVISRRLDCSSISISAITYGTGTLGFHGWWLIVNVATLPRPLTGSGLSSRLRHSGQTGEGGWM
jgi:hypothetical protein